MPQTDNFNSSEPPSAQRRCPVCGRLLFLAEIVPTERSHEDQRTFECATCAYSETVVVQFS